MRNMLSVSHMLTYGQELGHPSLIGAMRHPCSWDGVLLATRRATRKNVLLYRTVYRTRKRDLEGI